MSTYGLIGLLFWMARDEWALWLHERSAGTLGLAFVSNQPWPKWPHAAWRASLPPMKRFAASGKRACLQTSLSLFSFTPKTHQLHNSRYITTQRLHQNPPEAHNGTDVAGESARRLPQFCQKLWGHKHWHPGSNIKWSRQGRPNWARQASCTFVDRQTAFVKSYARHDPYVQIGCWWATKEET